MSAEEKFAAAVRIIENLPQNGTFQPSDDLMLKLYAYYMQATEGPCNTPKPSVWYYSLRTKWNAWNDLGNMEKEVAMEKYVEELTKVIETMSYNEHVSRLMSLMGPFYEVVPTDEIDGQSDKKLNNNSCAEYQYPVKNLGDLQLSKNKSSHINSVRQNSSTNHDFSADSSGNSYSPCEKISKAIKHDDHADITSNFIITQQPATDIFKTKVRNNNHPFSSKSDMLILAMINLQNSLEEIVKKLEKLQNLAKFAKLNENANKDIEQEEWRIGTSGAAFAILWPIIIHLCTRKF